MFAFVGWNNTFLYIYVYLSIHAGKDVSMYACMFIYGVRPSVYSFVEFSVYLTLFKYLIESPSFCLSIRRYLYILSHVIVCLPTWLKSLSVRYNKYQYVIVICSNAANKNSHNNNKILQDTSRMANNTIILSWRRKKYNTYYTLYCHYMF